MFTLFSSLLLLGFLVKNMCPVSIKLFILYAESALFHMQFPLFSSDRKYWFRFIYRSALEINGTFQRKFFVKLWVQGEGKISAQNG